MIAAGPSEDPLRDRRDPGEHGHGVENRPVEDDVLAGPDRVEPEFLHGLEVLRRPPDAAACDAELRHLAPVRLASPSMQ